MGSKTRLSSYCTKRANNGVNLVTSRKINTRLARPIAPLNLNKLATLYRDKADLPSCFPLMSTTEPTYQPVIMLKSVMARTFLIFIYRSIIAIFLYFKSCVSTMAKSIVQFKSDNPLRIALVVPLLLELICINRKSIRRYL